MDGSLCYLVTILSYNSYIRQLIFFKKKKTILSMYFSPYGKYKCVLLKTSAPPSNSVLFYLFISFFSYVVYFYYLVGCTHKRNEQ